ncbi:MAG: hypothetical protein IIV14_00625 [Bacteroidaceae bacterium]|nr:hypothetical protein [Bacteroidaceae bacterium]
MATPNYDVNYDDKRFTEVETDKKAALAEVDQTYDGMISQTDQFYNQQIAAANNYAAQQKKIQQEQTDFAIEQINQQKEQATKDYQKEQSGAYVDWQKQSNEYGANAEAAAAQGMTNTGWSESSQVSMYNTYQNRVATAREAYSRAILNYDNAIKDARLQNNAALAEIAYNALRTQLELSLEGFQYKNTLVLAKADKKTELDNTYYSRYQDVLKQINTENAMAEEVRQYNESLAEERRQYDRSYALQQAELQLQKDKFAYQKAQDAKASSGGGSSGGSIKKSGSGSSSKKKSTSYSKLVKDNNSKLANISSKIPSGSSSKQSKIDTKSLNKVGLSGASGTTIAKAEEKGIIESYEENGKIKFKTSTNYLKNNMLYNRLR